MVLSHLFSKKLLAFTYFCLKTFSHCSVKVRECCQHRKTLILFAFNCSQISDTFLYLTTNCMLTMEKNSWVYCSISPSYSQF